GYNGNVPANVNNLASRFKFNGVELEKTLGLNLYEMDFRHYNPAVARFTAIDPVTHFEFSTYTAFDNNPVFWADPSGADAEGYYDQYDLEWGGYMSNPGDPGYSDEGQNYGYNFLDYNSRSEEFWNLGGELNQIVITYERDDSWEWSMDWFDFELPKYKDPFPDWKWDWLDNRRSDDFVHGPNRRGDEGAKRGKDGKIYYSYQGDDLNWNGGGGQMKFWLHESNLGKHFVRGIGFGEGAVERYNSIKSNIAENNRVIMTEPIIIEVNYKNYSKSPIVQPETYEQARNDSIRVMQGGSAISVTIEINN